jgi:hypothetical protein
MTSRARLTILALAAAAALLAAPSTTSAATPNRLEDAACSPCSGTTVTTFTLSVSYISSAGYAATAVTATAAGLAVPLSLASGSDVDGVWSGRTWLPMGTWTVTFAAVAVKGPSAELTGPSVIVKAPVLGPKATPGGSAPITEPTSPPATPLPAPASVYPSASPSMAPAPTDGGVGPEGSASDSGGPDGAIVDGPSSSAASGGGGDSTPLQAPASAGPVAADAATPDPAGASPAASPGRHSGTVRDTLPLGTDLAATVLGLGMLGVAAVALIGVVWMALGRRRPHHDDEAAGPAPEAALTERALRRATMRQSDDPILAALGLTDPDPDGAAQFSSDPGRRPVRSPRRRPARPPEPD